MSAWWLAVLVCILLFLAAACALWCLPRRLIAEPGVLPEAFRSTLPPRHLLNRTGRMLHSLLWLAAASLGLLVIGMGFGALPGS